jgi:hypothetical protein
MKSLNSDYSAENVSKTMKGKQLANDLSLDFSKNSDKLGLSLEAYDDGVSDMCNGMKMGFISFRNAIFYLNSLPLDWQISEKLQLTL